MVIENEYCANRPMTTNAMGAQLGMGSQPNSAIVKKGVILI